MKCLSVVFLFLAFSVCIPAARAGLFSLSERDEISIGQQAAVKVEQQAKLFADEEVQDYVMQLGMQLARLSTRPNLPWRFRVIDDPRINAFALPGGYIYVHSKTLQVARSEAEFAAVIAHEIGHIEGRHHKAKIEQAMRYQLGLGVLGTVLGNAGDAALIAGRLLAQGELTRYSREAEVDADRRGVTLLYRAGFQPLAMSRFLEHIAALENGKSDVLGDFFSDHQAARERVAVTRAQAESLRDRLWRSESHSFQRLSRRMSGTHSQTRNIQGQRIRHSGGDRINDIEGMPGARIRRKAP